MMMSLPGLRQKCTSEANDGRGKVLIDFANSYVGYRETLSFWWKVVGV